MKKTIFKSLFVLGITSGFLTLNSCYKKEDPNLVREDKKGGCHDFDSPFYNPDIDYIVEENCKYAYTKAYEVTYYNRQENGDDWDDYWCVTPNYTPADLILRIKEIDSTEWFFESTVNEDQAYNTRTKWVAPAAVKLHNTNYVYELIDEDGASDFTCDTGSDLIFTTVFNPFDHIANPEDGVAIIKSKVGQDSIQIKIYFDLKNEI